LPPIAVYSIIWYSKHAPHKTTPHSIWCSQHAATPATGTGDLLIAISPPRHFGYSMTARPPSPKEPLSLRTILMYFDDTSGHITWYFRAAMSYAWLSEYSAFDFFYLLMLWLRHALSLAERTVRVLVWLSIYFLCFYIDALYALLLITSRVSTISIDFFSDSGWWFYVFTWDGYI
jgi:hypothetical protein